MSEASFQHVPFFWFGDATGSLLYKWEFAEYSISRRNPAFHTLRSPPNPPRMKIMISIWKWNRNNNPRNLPWIFLPHLLFPYKRKNQERAFLCPYSSSWLCWKSSRAEAPKRGLRIFYSGVNSAYPAYLVFWFAKGPWPSFKIMHKHWSLIGHRQEYKTGL